MRRLSKQMVIVRVLALSFALIGIIWAMHSMQTQEFANKANGFFQGLEGAPPNKAVDSGTGSR